MITVTRSWPARRHPYDTSGCRVTEPIRESKLASLSISGVMAVQWLLLCHGLVTLLVVVSFLCGQWPIFAGTPIQRIHHFLTYGAYDYLLRFVGYIFGSKGTNAILAVESFCCDRPNPILQVIYLAIIGVTYYIITISTFKYVPGYYLSGIHRDSEC